MHFIITQEDERIRYFYCIVLNVVNVNAVKMSHFATNSSWLGKQNNENMKQKHQMYTTNKNQKRDEKRSLENMLTNPEIDSNKQDTQANETRIMAKRKINCPSELMHVYRSTEIVYRNSKLSFPKPAAQNHMFACRCYCAHCERKKCQ